MLSKKINNIDFEKKITEKNIYYLFACLMIVFTIIAVLLIYFNFVSPNFSWLFFIPQLSLLLFFIAGLILLFLNYRDLVQFTLLKISENIKSRDGVEFIITERKIAEDAQRLSLAQLRSNLDNTPNVAIQWYDGDGRVLYWNPASESLYGWKAGDALGKTLDQLIHTEEEANEFKQILAEIKKSGKPFGPYEAVVKRGDGSNGWVLATTFEIPMEEGRAGFSCMDIDITERKIAEESLKESEERFKNLAEASFEGILIHINGIVQDTNSFFARMCGYESPEDLIGKNGLLTIPFTPESQAIVEEKIRLNVPEPYEIILKKPDGTTYSAETQARDIIYRGRKARVVAMRDITEKKIIEKELEKHRNNLELIVHERTEELKATNEELYLQREELQVALDKLNKTQNQLIQSEKMASLGILSAGIAHEINNPLNFIHGGIMAIENYINENLPEHLPDLQPLINAVNTGVIRSTNIVTSLSHYSRRDDLPWTNCDLHSIIDNCITMLQNQIKNKVEIIRLFTEKETVLFGSEGKFYQVFLNIIANAEQSIDGQGTITFTTDILANDFVIKISDTGHGIDQENMKKIFDPFFTTKAPGKGTGLGLSITYNIVREFNGTIDFYSQPEKGTDVIVKLPLKKAEIK
jgi:PAS domain S-box-containing protein